MISTAGIAFALFTFVVTFLLARTLSKGFRKRKAKFASEQERKNQSRQVRRAQQRRGKGPG
jgi:flagellar biosynthesis/type III secretory pathway M-ring protein FliF/YscJ